MKTDKMGIIDISTNNFLRTAERLDWPGNIRNRLLRPKEKIEISLNPALPSGKQVNIQAFLVRHSDILGPAKGGIRMMKEVNLDDISGLAMDMTWKTALIGVPFGGGKSGISYETAGLSAEDKETIIRSFTRGARRYFGPELYIPAPDIGTNQTDMGYIRDCISYSSGTSITKGCFVTGKPVILGGIVGRREATGNGVIFCVMAACKKLGKNIKDCKVVVQGFGNVGSVAAISVAQAGAKVVGISDIDSGLYNPKGINLGEIITYLEIHQTVSGYRHAETVSNFELLELDCDILIPAAVQSQITRENATKIKARIIAEGANSPVTPDADKILEDNGVLVIPDILCNAGGVFVSYLEYCQETQRSQKTEKEVIHQLETRMINKFDEVYNYSQERKLAMRDSAMNLAVSRIYEGIKARGMLP